MKKVLCIIAGLTLGAALAGCHKQYPEPPGVRMDRLTERASELEVQGRYAEALDAYQEATDLAPHNAEMWRRQGRVQLRMGHTLDARTSLENSLIGEPDNVEALFYLGVLDVQQGNLGAASVMAEAIRNNTPLGQIPTLALELEELIQAHRQGQTQLRRTLSAIEDRSRREGKRY